MIKDDVIRYNIWIEYISINSITINITITW